MKKTPLRTRSRTSYSYSILSEPGTSAKYENEYERNKGPRRLNPHLECFNDPSEPVLGLPIDRAGALLPADLLRGGETILLLLKPSPLYIVLGCWETLLVIAAAAAGSLWLEGRLGREWFEDRAMVGLCLILIAVRLFYQFMEWMSRTYVLTDRRVIRLMGVWRVQMFQAPLSSIQHVQLLHTIREKSFGLGTVSFSTTGRTIPDAYWVMVARPEAVHRKVMQAIHRYGK